MDSKFCRSVVDAPSASKPSFQIVLKSVPDKWSISKDPFSTLLQCSGLHAYNQSPDQSWPHLQKGRVVDSSNFNPNMIQTHIEFLRYLICSESCYTTFLIVAKLRVEWPRYWDSIPRSIKIFFSFPQHLDRLCYPVKTDTTEFSH
jgi:hypothetical protein